MSADRTVKVYARYKGGAFIARAGRGKKATHASSTDRPIIAARRAAAKYFRLDACNVQTEDDIVLKPLGDGTPVDLYGYTAELPETGGAS